MQGYVQVKVGKDHWAGKNNGWAQEHRVVMGEMLGRPMMSNESAHHINGNREDNRPENLELWVTSQPYGQRASDLVAYAKEIIKLYDSF